MVIAASARLKALSNARVKNRDNDVGSQGNDGVERNSHHNGSLDNREIAVQDHVVDDFANPGTRKDDFGKHSSREQAAEADTDQRYRRKDGDPERITVDDRLDRQSVV